MLVKKQVVDDTSEQSFWADGLGMINLNIVSFIRQWPNSDLMIASLEQSETNVLDYSLLRQRFPEWRNMKSIHAWLQHYSRYDFLSLHFGEDNDYRAITEELKTHVTDELSVMLGVTPPTIFERIQERKRLSLIGWRVRESRKAAAKESQIGSSPEGRLSKEEYVRLQKKRSKLLQQTVPATYIIKDTTHVCTVLCVFDVGLCVRCMLLRGVALPGTLICLCSLLPVESNVRNEQAGEPNEKVLDQAPPWVAEEVGHDMARRLGRAMKELSIDEHLLRFFNHDSWEMVGVQDPILRCRLLRRQKQQEATSAVKNRDSDIVKAAKTKAKEQKKAAAVAKAKELAEAAALAAAAADKAARDAEAIDEEEGEGEQEKGAILVRAQLLDSVLISAACDASSMRV